MVQLVEERVTCGRAGERGAPRGPRCAPAPAGLRPSRASARLIQLMNDLRARSTLLVSLAACLVDEEVVRVRPGGLLVADLRQRWRRPS